MVNGNDHAVDDVQHRDREDIGTQKPVGHIDMVGLALHDSAKEDDGVNHPYHRDEYVDRPFQLSVFLALCDTQGQGNCGRQNHQLPPPEGESGQCVGDQSHLAGALHDVIRRGEQG